MTAGMTTATAMHTTDLLNWQDEQTKTGNYEFLGKVWLIVLEAAKGAAVPEPSVASVLGTRLEFYGEGLPVAQTRDHSSLLLLSPVVRPDGTVGLPDIPDPTWKPPIPTAAQVEGNYVAPDAPKIRQLLEDRARGQLKGTDYLVFGPVAQILIRPEGIPEGWIARCFGDPGSGTQMELLVSKRTGKAFLIGGRYQIERCG